MVRRLSKLETGILWLAKRNRNLRERLRLESKYEVEMEEILEGYFGITFRSGFVKAGGTYFEQSLPPGQVASERFTRAEIAIWFAVSRLEDDDIVKSFWGACGTSIWLAGVNLCEEGIEQAKGIPDVIPTKRRWGRIVDPPCPNDSQSELDELQESILLLALRNRTARGPDGNGDVDLVEWEVLHVYHGFPLQQNQDLAPESPIPIPGSFSEDTAKTKKYLSGRQSVFQACRGLEAQGLIEMGGPGAPAMARWADKIRGWGWDRDQEAKVLQELLPFGAWDTVTLTNRGVEKAWQIKCRRQ
jgi:hypothetical protein